MPTTWNAFDASYVVIGVATLLFVLICYFKIAQKTGLGSIAWWAFVPVLNLFLILKIAGRPMWWVVLIIAGALIPIIGWLVLVVIMAIVHMDIARRRSRPAWWGLLCLLPVLMYVVLGLLAFKDEP